MEAQDDNTGNIGYYRTIITQATEPNDAVQPPVILINGGPGYPHNYMLPLKVKVLTKDPAVAFERNRHIDPC